MPLEVAELLFLDWAASSDGATHAGLGYLFQMHSSGGYTTLTTSFVESTCRSLCVNQATNWVNMTGGALTHRCQHFVMLDQSSVAGVNKMKCLFFRGGYPHLHSASGSSLPSERCRMCIR